MPPPRHPLDALLAVRGLLFPWVPVCLALGIGAYFARPAEPGSVALALTGTGALAALALRLASGERWHPLWVAAGLVLAGFLAAALRADLVAAPVLARPYYGPVEGRVVALDRSASDRLRITLDRVVLAGVAPAATPHRVRLSLAAPDRVPEAGATVMLTARLAPPQGPVEPGGFDFQRSAWFDRLGGVGYTQSPLVLWAPPEGAPVARLRQALARGIRAGIPGAAGAFAAAVATGDRSALPVAATDDLRAANLAHLLAISGLHMGLVTGFVFGALRAGLALVPRVALRVPAKKIAALAALGAGGFYLALSGGNVATVRAFVMVAVMFGAVLFDRRALTLRSVALAAALILLTQPESLTEPGFQMSFAATTALVAGYGGLHRRMRAWAVPRWLWPVVSLIAASALAGAATAPVAAATFHRLAVYGLAANLAAVPLMGLVVMPAAVIAALLAPLGLAAPALWVMGQGSAAILAIAAEIGGLDGAVVAVRAPPATALPLLALGALWLVLWRGALRWPGAAAMAAALALWSWAGRPAALVSGDGALVGVMTEAGRTLSRPGGAGFVASAWLLADGDDAAQAEAAARPGPDRAAGRASFNLGGQTVVALWGKAATAALGSACAGAALVVLAADAPADAPKECRILDRRALQRTGAVALVLRAGRIEIRSARAEQGQRPWVPVLPAPRPARQ